MSLITTSKNPQNYEPALDISTINSEQIRDILTLRYHPTSSKLLPEISWKDCVQKDDTDLVARAELELKKKHF